MNRKCRLLVIFFLILVQAFVIPSFFTVQAQCVITDVGAPKTSPNPPIECGSSTSGEGPSGKCGAVIKWGQEISDNLKVGGGGPLSGDGYDNLTKAITSDCRKTDPKLQNQFGQYWCTLLIVDSYDLAGIPIAKIAGVVAMRSWWKTAKGFKYVDYASAGQQLKEVKPGFAMLMESVAGKHTEKEHVNMIKTIKLDDKGNGKITTLDSNSSKKSHTYTVAKWKILNTAYPARGFGGK